MLHATSMAFGAGLLFACVGIIYSRATRADFDFLAFMRAYCLMVVAGAWVFIADWGGLLLGRTPRVELLVIVMAASGIAAGAGMLILQEAMRRGHKGVCWTVGQSAMVMPLLMSVLLFNDSLGMLSIAGIAAIMFSVVLLGMSIRRTASGDGSPSRNWFGLALLTFACFGLQQCLGSLPSRWETWWGFQDLAGLRIPIYFSAQLVFYSLVLRVRRKKPGPPALTLALAMALCVVCGHFLMYEALDRYTSLGAGGVTFPVITSVNIVLVALFSLFVLREPSRPTTLFGIALGVAGVLMIAL